MLLGKLSLGKRLLRLHDSPDKCHIVYLIAGVLKMKPYGHVPIRIYIGKRRYSHIIVLIGISTIVFKFVIAQNTLIGLLVKRSTAGINA